MPIKPVDAVVRDRRRIVWTVATLISFIALARCASAQVPVMSPATVLNDSTHEVTHTVRKGDTLWDLAQTYLKNPFRWPDIFRRNTDIVKNPHWIYPGEVIRIPISEVRPEVASQLRGGNVVARVSTSSRPLTVFSTTNGPSRNLGIMNESVTADKYRALGVRAGEIEAAPYLDRIGGPRDGGEIRAGVDRPAISTSAEAARSQLNDEVYISLPKGMTPRLGDRYMAYTLGDEVENVGQLVIPTGILRIESIGANGLAVARLVRQFGEVRLGQRLLAAESAMSVMRVARAVPDGITGKVLLVNQDPLVPTVQHYVVLSPSSLNGVSVGDEFTLISDTMGRDDPTPAPPVSAAIVQVVRVTPYASTAIVLNQGQPVIKEGMPIRLTARMP
jgi:LysM repeat protein